MERSVFSYKAHHCVDVCFTLYKSTNMLLSQMWSTVLIINLQIIIDLQKTVHNLNHFSKELIYV